MTLFVPQKDRISITYGVMSEQATCHASWLVKQSQMQHLDVEKLTRERPTLTFNAILSARAS